MTSWLELEERYKSRSLAPLYLPIVVFIISIFCIFSLLKNIDTIKVTHPLRFITAIIFSICIAVATHFCMC